jgi:sarcosine oxidase subunit beta
MADAVPTATDIAIIGGGIMGTSLAWHLAQRRAGRVTLFDRSVVASGASGRTGALLRQHYSNRPEATLAWASHQVFANWPEIVGGPPVHTPTGLVFTIETGPGCEANLERLRRNVALQNDVGIPSRLISPAELKEMQPFTHVDDLGGVAFEPASGYVDAIAATRGMAQAAVRAGATIVEGCAVLAIESDGERVLALRTSCGRVVAGTVVCAAGPWSPPLLAGVGLTVPIEALRVQVAIVQRPLAFDLPHFVYLDTVAGIFCRPWGSGQTLVGLGGGDQHDPVNPDRYDERNDPDYPARAIAALSRRMPVMATASYLHGHAGLYDMTPDAHPILGPAGPDGLYLMLGFNGAGFKKGPATGQAMAELILDGRGSLVDLDTFRLDRFDSDAWQTPWSDGEYVFLSDFGHKF